MLTIAPRPSFSMTGRKARIMRCIDLTLRSKEKSQSASEHCSTLPSCTKPAQLTRMCGAPNSLVTDCASASTAAVERTSSFTHCFAASPLSFVSSRSLAMTVAPSAMNASAMARPMPWPAAVVTAILSFKRLVIRNPPGSLLGGSPPSPGGRGSRESVIVPRHALLRDALILDGGGEHHAVGKLLDHGALDLLPGRLARWEVEAALAGERVAAAAELFGRDHDVG